MNKKLISSVLFAASGILTGIQAFLESDRVSKCLCAATSCLQIACSVCCLLSGIQEDDGEVDDEEEISF